MQLKSNSSMLSSTKSIDMASTTSTLSIKTNIERTADGRFVVKKANSLDDEFSSEAISSCSDTDDKTKSLESEKQNSSSVDIVFDESDGSDRDSMLDNFDVTLVDDNECFSPKNDAERMFFEVVEVLRFEQEVNPSENRFCVLISSPTNLNHFLRRFTCEVRRNHLQNIIGDVQHSFTGN